MFQLGGLIQDLCQRAILRKSVTFHPAASKAFECHETLGCCTRSEEKYCFSVLRISFLVCQSRAN